MIQPVQLEMTFLFVFSTQILHVPLHGHDENGTFLIIFECFPLFSTMQTHPQACITSQNTQQSASVIMLSIMVASLLIKSVAFLD